MAALRFILIGYGVAMLLGMSVGAHLGYLAGGLTAWFGGGALSVLVAWIWHRAEGWGTAEGDAAPSPSSMQATLALVGGRRS
jgi:hypothetical protein